MILNKQSIQMGLIGLLSLGLLWASESNLNRQQGYESNTGVSINLPGSIIGKSGFGGFVSSALWPSAVLQIADIYVENKRNDWIAGYLRSIAEMDTLWSSPRLIASWALPLVPHVDPNSVIWFLEDGAKRFPSEWLYRLTWAEYILENKTMDSVAARDSAAKILRVFADTKLTIPEYVRGLAFTLIQKNGDASSAMNLLLGAYLRIDDPLVHAQMQRKIISILQKEGVDLGGGQTEIQNLIAVMMGAKSADSRGVIQRILVDLVDQHRQGEALRNLRMLQEQYRQAMSESGRER